MAGYVCFTFHPALWYAFIQNPDKLIERLLVTASCGPFDMSGKPDSANCGKCCIATRKTLSTLCRSDQSKSATGWVRNKGYNLI